MGSFCLVVAATVVAQAPGSWLDEWPAARQAVRADPAPKSITRGKHYVASDERRHDLFHTDVVGKGGVFVGVGTNQNYLMAAWSEPELLVVVDFDAVIVDVHEVYRLAFAAAPTPDAFVELFSHRKPSRQRFKTLIDAVADKTLRRRLRQTFTAHRVSLRWALVQSRDRLRELGVTSYLDDQHQYDVLRRLFAEDRVLFVRGDFTGDKTLADLGEQLRKLGQPVRVLYLSNIEQYFGWNKGRFRDNMQALPMDAQTVVLRCYGFGRFRTADGNYRYYVQSGDNFRAWLGDLGTRSVKRLLKTETSTGVPGFYRLVASPPVAQR